MVPTEPCEDNATHLFLTQVPHWTDLLLARQSELSEIPDL